MVRHRDAAASNCGQGTLLTCLHSSCSKAPKWNADAESKECLDVRKKNVVFVLAGPQFQLTLLVCLQSVTE